MSHFNIPGDITSTGRPEDLDSGHREGNRICERGTSSRAFRTSSSELAPSFILHCLWSSLCKEGKGEEIYFIHQKEVKGTLIDQDVGESKQEPQRTDSGLVKKWTDLYSHFFLHYVNFYDWKLHLCLYVRQWTVAMVHFFSLKQTGFTFRQKHRNAVFTLNQRLIDCFLHYLIFFWACFLNII